MEFFFGFLKMSDWQLMSSNLPVEDTEVGTEKTIFRILFSHNFRFNYEFENRAELKFILKSRIFNNYWVQKQS